MASRKFELIMGPRAPTKDLEPNRLRYLWPSLCLAAAAILMIASIFLPYWSLVLAAPQYPDGLRISAYVDRVEGDVAEIDAWNQYIGIRPLDEVAEFEKSIAVFAITTLAVFVLAAIFVHSPWSRLLSLPAVSLPLVFLADLYFWLRNFGQNLDFHSPYTIEQSAPTIIGEGIIGPFRTMGSVDFGLLMASAASILILVGLYLQRRAYKPLATQNNSES
jgi:copper chaperone NosL